MRTRRQKRFVCVRLSVFVVRVCMKDGEGLECVSPANPMCVGFDVSVGCGGERWERESISPPERWDPSSFFFLTRTFSRHVLYIVQHIDTARTSIHPEVDRIFPLL